MGVRFAAYRRLSIHSSPLPPVSPLLPPPLSGIGRIKPTDFLAYLEQLPFTEGKGFAKTF